MATLEKFRKKLFFLMARPPPFCCFPKPAIGKDIWIGNLNLLGTQCTCKPQERINSWKTVYPIMIAAVCGPSVRSIS